MIDLKISRESPGYGIGRSGYAKAARDQARSTSFLHPVVENERRFARQCATIAADRRMVGVTLVHTHLKGRIFSTEGVSYLVLQEPGESPDWLRVKALDPSRTIRQMHCEEVQRHVEAAVRR